MHLGLDALNNQKILKGIYFTSADSNVKEKELVENVENHFKRLVNLLI